jgi:hypothetical protein
VGHLVTPCRRLDCNYASTRDPHISHYLKHLSRRSASEPRAASHPGDEPFAVLASRDERRRREQRSPPADRYALERLISGVQAPAIASGTRTRLKAAVAVFATIGSNGTDDDVVHRTGWSRTRMESRYIQSWIAQHQDCGAQILVTALVEAVDHARAADRGPVLPDLAPKPIAYPWTEAASR